MIELGTTNPLVFHDGYYASLRVGGSPILGSIRIRWEGVLAYDDSIGYKLTPRPGAHIAEVALYAGLVATVGRQPVSILSRNVPRLVIDPLEDVPGLNSADAGAVLERFQDINPLGLERATGRTITDDFRLRAGALSLHYLESYRNALTQQA